MDNRTKIRLKKDRFARQPINENTILSKDYLIFGDEELWPAMEWKYPLNLSPVQLMSFLMFGVPISLLSLIMTWPGNLYLGAFGTLIIAGIWFLVSKRLSRLDWAVVLNNGNWRDHVQNVDDILDSGFIINYSNGRVYNRLEKPFVIAYRKSHPGWWRRSKKHIFDRYDETHWHLLDKELCCVKPFWVTRDEWESIRNRADELIDIEKSFWDTDKGKSLLQMINKGYRPTALDYIKIAAMEFYMDHKNEIENAKNI